MELLFSGNTICSQQTLKRLLLLGNKIGFMDRPSIMFPDWGTVGVESPIRRFDTSGLPVQISAHKPPSGPVSNLYLKCLEDDLKSPLFIEAFLEGLSDDFFATKFLQLKADYGGVTGEEIRAALIADKSLRAMKYTMPESSDMKAKISTSEERQSHLRLLLAEGSFSVTNSMIVSGKNELVPVTDDLFYSKLLYTRFRSNPAESPLKLISSYVGIAVLSSVLPDELIEKVDIDAICEYRENSKSEYAFWIQTINEFAAKMDLVDPKSAQDEIQKLIVTDIKPKMAEYYRSMESIRDKQFGELVKTVIKWEFPTLSIAQLVGASWANLAIAFATALVPAIAPQIVDYFVDSKDVKRINSMSYLVGVTKRSW